MVTHQFEMLLRTDLERERCPQVHSNSECTGKTVDADSGCIGETHAQARAEYVSLHSNQQVPPDTAPSLAICLLHDCRCPCGYGRDLNVHIHTTVRTCNSRPCSLTASAPKATPIKPTQRYSPHHSVRVLLCALCSTGDFVCDHGMEGVSCLFGTNPPNITITPAYLKSQYQRTRTCQTCSAVNDTGY